jgi:hypothetical protein
MESRSPFREDLGAIFANRSDLAPATVVRRSQSIEIMNFDADGAVIRCELQQKFSR